MLFSPLCKTHFLQEPIFPKKMLLRWKYFFLIFAVMFAINALLFHSFLYRIPSDNDDQPTKLNYPLRDYGIFKEVFQDPDLFLHNYAQMEQDFKIFVYPNKDDGVYADSENYLQYVINKYPYWNLTTGVDHFFVTCHDNGASLSERVPLNNSITILCATHHHSRHGIHHKHHHITLPQIRLPFVCSVGGNDIHNRTTLAFWACPAILWDNHPDREKFKTSKYCICNGAAFYTRICITDSIHCGCVPVILSDDYELPFNYILDWTKFSVIINKDSAHRVEKILEAIPYSKFNELHYNTVKVQRHFEWNSPSRRYDAFHMIMYELWLRLLSLAAQPSYDP